MAGFEKICEFSGEHCGFDMYSWKRNLIQVAPVYRRLFRGCDHVLEVKVHQHRYEDGFGSSLSRKGYAEDGRGWGENFKSEREAHDFFKRFGYRPVTQYEYTLNVYADQLQGEVGGRYVNYTTDLGCMLRKMKRLVGGRLNIKK